MHGFDLKAFFKCMKSVHELVIPEKDTSCHVLDFGPVPKLPKSLVRERHCFAVSAEVVQQAFHAQQRLYFRFAEINAHRERRGRGGNDLLQALKRLFLAVLQVKGDGKAEERVGPAG